MGNASWPNVVIAILVVFCLLLLASVPAVEAWYAFKEHRARRRQALRARSDRARARRAELRVAQAFDGLPVTTDCPLEERVA